jgi:hypothetical protein
LGVELIDFFAIITKKVMTKERLDRKIDFLKFTNGSVPYGQKKRKIYKEFKLLPFYPQN